MQTKKDTTPTVPEQAIVPMRLNDGLPIHVIVVTDNDTGEQALYVGGTLRDQDGTIYACDIASAVGGAVIQFSSLTADHEGDWPERFEDLDITKLKPTGNNERGRE